MVDQHAIINNKLEYLLPDPPKDKFGFKIGHMPLILLACEGMHQAIESEREKGHSVNYLVLGYAIGGHVTQVKDYLIDHKANINWAILGYAIGGHTQQIEKYLELEHTAIYWIVLGYAIGGYTEQVELYIHRRQSLSDWAALGYAIGGYLQQAEYCRMHHQASAKWIAVGLAIGRHSSQVEHYQSTHAIKPKWVAMGYAMGGHSKHVDYYRSHHQADIQSIVTGYAIGGYTQHVEHWRIIHQANTNWIAEGYAIGGHDQYLRNYLKNYKLDVNKIVASCAIGGHSSYAQFYAFHFYVKADNIALGYAIGGHSQQAETYRICNNMLPERIAQGYILGGHLRSPTKLLRVLAYSNVEFYDGFNFCRELVEASKKLASKQMSQGNQVDNLQALDEYYDPQKFYEMALYLRGKIINYRMTFPKAYAWMRYSRQLLPLSMLLEFPEKLGGADTTKIIAAFLTGLPEQQIPALFAKIKAMHLYHKPPRLAEEVTKSIRHTLKQASQEQAGNNKPHHTKDIEYNRQLEGKLELLADFAQQGQITPSSQLRQTIALIKDYKQLAEQSYYQRESKWLSFFSNKPVFATACQKALKCAPDGLVKKVQPKSYITIGLEQDSAQANGDELEQAKNVRYSCS